MKTVKDIDAEITDLKKKYTEKELIDLRLTSSRTFNAHFAKIAWLEMMKVYLGNSPTESFISGDLARLENLLGKIKAGFKEWLRSNPDIASQTESKAKTKYNNEMDVKTINGQITTYKYLLGL